MPRKHWLLSVAVSSFGIMNDPLKPDVQLQAETAVVSRRPDTVHGMKYLEAVRDVFGHGAAWRSH